MKARKRTLHAVALAVLTLVNACVVSAAQETVVCDFERPGDLEAWKVTATGSRLVTGVGVTHGKSALEMTFDPKGRWAPVALRWDPPLKDWSAYDLLVIDVFNPGDEAISAHLSIGDEAWRDKSTYWNRHNAYLKLPPGPGQLRIPVKGLYRGEAGGRNKDIPTNIDPAHIVRFEITFGSKGQTGRVIVDHVRFVKGEPRPENVRAFDLGPDDQSVMPAWTPVGRETAYAAERKFGWSGGIPPIDSAARDTTFGPVLTRDFVECAGTSFRVDVPKGRYDVLLIYENCGYWGQEQAKHTIRKVLVDGKIAWSEERPDGKRTVLFRFEDVEPIGVDLWESYMLPEITKPVRFQADAGDDGLTLRFEADAAWSSKVSALAVYPAGDATAKKWVDAQIDALAEEFRSQAVRLDPPPPEYVPPAAWKDKPLVAWPGRIEDELTPDSVPANPPAPGDLALSCEAVRGEYEPVCLVLRPVRDLGSCRATLEWDGARTLPATVKIVRYGTRRGFGNLAYRTVAHHLREVKRIDLPKDVTREFVVTFNVPVDAKPGTYSPRLRLTDAAGDRRLDVPVRVVVHDVVLKRDTDFLMGMYGLFPPRTLMSPEERARYLERTLVLLREYGMNALVEEPTFTVTGWVDGKPRIDFTEANRFYALCREHGFTRGIRDHGTNFRNLHGWYEKGAIGERTERESGLDFETAMMRAFEALDAHARAEHWPVLFYKMCDETRVREVAERQLEFMKLMDRIHKRFPDTIQPLGSYSVNFRTRPADPNDMLYWHQRFFEDLAISNLNNHDETVLAEAKKLGRKVHIYNQGTSRYSFGLYQWSEFRKGVAARWQWHLNILHGYQFFDLDGREPDTSMILYGRGGMIYTTLPFERCREGAEDFYLYQTLYDLITANRKAGRKPGETDQADAMLKELVDALAVNQRTPPADYDAYRLKSRVIEAIKSIR